MRIEAYAEARRIVQEAEEYVHRRRAERTRLGGREQRVASFAGILEHHQLAADHIDTGALMRQKFCQRRVVGAIGGGAVERTRDVAELWQWSEIGADGHGVQKRARSSRIIRPLRATAADSAPACGRQDGP